MTHKELITMLEENLAAERKEVDEYFKERGMKPLSDEDFDPQSADENCAWEAGFLTGYEKAICELKNSLTK